MSSVCVLTLCGLPAAGKTTFANSFADYLQQTNKRRPNECDFAETQKQSGSSLISYRVIRIDYDELIPSEVETSLVTGSKPFEVCQWKLYRKAILRCLDSLLGRFCNHTSEAADDCVCDESSDVIYSSVSTVFAKYHDSLNADKQCGPAVLIIDDNMYYASMRYQIYQLARKYSTGYVQLYFPVDIKEAQERNSQRNFPVMDDIIVSMSSKMDIPSPENSWEAMTLEWHATDSCQRNFDKVITLIENSLHKPVVPAANNVESEREWSRSVCSKNVQHQADCILRHLTTDFVASLRTDVSDAADVKQRAMQANAVRQTILSDLRQQTIVIPQSAIDSLKHNDSTPSTADHPLHVFIKQLFTERLQQVS